MSETKHTLGKWEYRQMDAPLGAIVKNGITLAFVCDHPYIGRNEQIANARLISKAPELLALADKYIRRYCDRCDVLYRPRQCSTCEVLEEKKLIAEVKGETK